MFPGTSEPSHLKLRELEAQELRLRLQLLSLSYQALTRILRLFSTPVDPSSSPSKTHRQSSGPCEAIGQSEPPLIRCLCAHGGDAGVRTPVLYASIRFQRIQGEYGLEIYGEKPTFGIYFSSSMAYSIFNNNGDYYD